MAKATENFLKFEEWRSLLPAEAVHFIDTSTDSISTFSDLFPLLVHLTNKLVIENRMLKAAMASTRTDVEDDQRRQSFTDSSFSDAEEIHDTDDRTFDDNVININDPALVAPEVDDAGHSEAYLTQEKLDIAVIPGYKLSRLPSIPKNAAVMGQVYKWAKWPLDSKRLSFLPIENRQVIVTISHVFTPDQFYVQLQEFDMQLIIMMRDLHLFLTTHGDYTCPKEMLEPGLPCAAPYESDYHRVIVTDVSDDKEHCNIFYVDFGTMLTVPSHLIRLMPQEFLQFPAQALRCRLTNMRPPNGAQDWPTETSDYFLQLVFQRFVWATVDYIDDMSGIAYVKLCDTNGDQDIHITDQLMDTGRASWVRERFQ